MQPSVDPAVEARINEIAITCRKYDCLRMNMAELMREVSSLPASQQKELAAYLLHLRLQNDTAWRSEMTRRIDDKAPSSNWVELHDWKKEIEKAGNE